MKRVECVPNFSEGRDPEVIESLAQVAAAVDGVQVLHIDAGADAHRMVMTLVGELEAVQRVTESGMTVDPYPGLVRGTQCRVRSGSMQGIEGVVVERRTRFRFVIEVSMLGQGASVEIDGSLIESIN